MADQAQLPRGLPLPGAMSSVAVGGPLPGAVLPGAVLPGLQSISNSTKAVGQNDLERHEQELSRLEAEEEQQAKEEQELLGLSMMFMEQQQQQKKKSPEQAGRGAPPFKARSPDPQAAQAHIDALKEQQLAAERAVQQATAVVAAAAQQAAQLEAERVQAQSAIAEAEAQRRAAEEQLAAQQAQLAQLNLQGAAATPPSSFAPGGNGVEYGGLLGGAAAPPPALLAGGAPKATATDYYQTAMNAAAGGGRGAAAAPPFQAPSLGMMGRGAPPAGIMGGGLGGPPLPPPQPPMAQQQPLGCEFCGRWLSEMALDQGNHMCDEFWQYSSEFQAVGAKSALLIAGVQYLKPEHLQSLAARFPNMRKVKHGPGFAEFNGLFTLADEHGQVQALRMLMTFGVRTIPLGHAASWRCLHLQLVPANSPHRVGQAEQSLHSLLPPDGARNSVAPPPAVGPPAASAGRGNADAWAQRANDAQRRLEPAMPPAYYVSPPMPPGGNSPGSTPGDWKCPNCSNINFAFRDKCNRCNTPRPGHVYGMRPVQPMQQAERRICPFTVMLMRVPPQATEAQVAEALLQFGELAAGGIKFHRQGAKFKQRRGRLPPDGLALHAFCRFLRPTAASAALQRGEILMFNQPVQINPAFMRGAMPPEAMSQLAGGAEMGAPDMGGMPPPEFAPPLPPNGMANNPPTIPPGPPDWDQVPLGPPGNPTEWQPNDHVHPPPGPPPPGMAPPGMAPPQPPGVYGRQMGGLGGVGNHGHDAGPPPPDAAVTAGRREELTRFLHVAMQLLWSFTHFRAQVCALPSSFADPLVSGVQTILTSLSERQGSPLATSLLHTALHGVYAEQARFEGINDPCEALEVVVGKFCASPDRGFAGCVEQLFGMNIMEMCECVCGEMLEPMTYKQSAAFVSVPTMLSAPAGGPGSLLHQLSTTVGPDCPVPDCGTKVMGIQRYLMAPHPQIITVSFTYDAMGPAAFDANVLGAVLSRIETQFDVQQAYKGVTQPTMAKLVSMLCCSQGGVASHGPRYLGIFFDGAARQWCSFDDTSMTPVGPDWTAVTSLCTQQQLQPACLFFQVQSPQGGGAPAPQAA